MPFHMIVWFILRKPLTRTFSLWGVACIALAEALPHNHTLKLLEMRYNALDIAGVMSIDVSLKLNTTLLELELAPVLESSHRKGFVSDFSLI
jgi:hypothetical protein